MRKYLFILSSALITYSCSPIAEPAKITTKKESEYDYQHRWIDNSNIINLIDNSTGTKKISPNDIYTYLGEPIYFEKFYIEDEDKVEKNTVLFWYKYKSRLYPVAEQNINITTQVSVDAMGNNQRKTKTSTSEYYQIKPGLAQEHSKWENDFKWLVVVMFDDKYELVLSDGLGTSYGLYRDAYNLSDAGYFENKNLNLLEQIKDVVEETISNLDSK